MDYEYIMNYEYIIECLILNPVLAQYISLILFFCPFLVIFLGRWSLEHKRQYCSHTLVCLHKQSGLTKLVFEVMLVTEMP